MGGQVKPKRRTARSRRRGSATIDYFLIICILLPLAALVLHFGPRAMHSVYDMLTVVVAWPFL
jgi:purine-cytosine permease-like protein